MNTQSLFPACEFKPHDFCDDLLLKISLLEASRYSQPTYIGYVKLEQSEIDKLAHEGRQRSFMNRKRQGERWDSSIQTIEHSALTADEIGRIAEGAVEKIIPLQAAAVVRGTDSRPDLMLNGRSFDIKASRKRAEPTFALKQILVGRYQALILAQLDEDGVVHLWACKCQPREWEPRRGNPDFYLIRAPRATDVLH